MDSNKNLLLPVELNYGIENSPSYNEQDYDSFIQSYLNDFNSMPVDKSFLPDNFAFILSEAKKGCYQMSILRAAWIKNSPVLSKLKIVKTFSPNEIEEELTYSPELKLYVPESITIKLQS